MKTWICLLIGICCILLLGCGRKTSELWGLELTGVEKVDLLDLHNFSRVRKNISPLSMQLELDRCAQMHAEWMSKNENMSHEEDSKENFDVGDRLKKYIAWLSVGENIAYGQDTPTMVTDDWMNSAGHRRNILSSNYKHVGFGISTSTSGNKYWCAVFSN
jgi:uncharacterized protein YkwD